jgi:hypothetical protein
MPLVFVYEDDLPVAFLPRSSMYYSLLLNIGRRGLRPRKYSLKILSKKNNCQGVLLIIFKFPTESLAANRDLVRLAL